MTREELVKYKFKAYQTLEYTNPRNGAVIEFMLIAVDFDIECFKVVPIDLDEYDENEVWIPAKYCKIPRRKLMVVK